MKELKEGFEKLDSEGKGAGTGKPTRLTRQAQAEVDNAAGGEGPAEEAIDVDNGADLGFDPNEDIPPVDVVASLNPEFYTLIESKKWQERKEVIDQLLETLNKAPKVEPSSDYSDLINALAKRISELNINVVIGAAQVLEKLGKGLPAPTFAGFKNTISKPLFERLKERKATVADALGGALDAMFTATGFAEFMDDITTYAKHKNPQVKQGTLSFLVRALKNTKLPPTQSEQKEIGSICTTTLEDSFEPVRAASAESLGTLMKIVGERAMNPIIEGLDGQRKSKVMEFYEKAEVKAKPGFKPKGVPPPAAKPVPAKPAPATAPKVGYLVHDLYLLMIIVRNRPQYLLNQRCPHLLHHLMTLMISQNLLHLQSQLQGDHRQGYLPRNLHLWLNQRLSQHRHQSQQLAAVNRNQLVVLLRLNNQSSQCQLKMPKQRQLRLYQKLS